MALPSLSTTAKSVPEESARRSVISIRAVALVLSAVLAVAAQVAFATPARRETGWWLALVTLVVGWIWQWRLDVTDWTQSAGRHWRLAPQWWRRILGAVLVVLGAALWFEASRWLSASWAGNFDRAWLAWVGAAVVMSAGFRALQAPQTPAHNKLSRAEWIVFIIAFLLAVGFRLANLDNYPPHDGVSQVEELQGGQFGTQFLRGDRVRWEFVGPAWLHALGIWVGGPTLLATRAASAVFSLLRVIPAYFWFRALAGPAGAMVGATLLAVSGWDTIVSRCSGHPDGLITFLCFALLVGPAVRGAWAAYPWIGLSAGYAATTYIAYRPLTAFAVIGVGIANIAHAYTRRWQRWAGVLASSVVIAALSVLMFLPLLNRLAGPGQFAHEYLNGLNRARGVEGYYNAADPWSVWLRKRWQRTALAAGLYYTVGDTNPAHNPDGQPLIDPTTGSLLLIGIGYSLLRCLRGFYGLILAAFAVTFTGTLIVTGNFDVLRAQVTMTYVYTLAAVGAGGLYAAAQRSLGRIGRNAVAALLVGGVLWAGYWNGKLLHDLWSSPVTRRHYRNDIAYLSVWLRVNAAGQRVIGLILSNGAVALQENDGSWLRGPDVSGQATWDVDTTLRTLDREPGPVMLVLFSDTMLQDLIDYFQYALPGVEFQLGPEDPTGSKRMAYAQVAEPARLTRSDRVRRLLCMGLRARFEVRRANGEVLASHSQVVPFVERSSWPGAVRQAADRYAGTADALTATWDGEFTIAETGTYEFSTSSYDGTLTTRIDGISIPDNGGRAITLQAGPHRVEMSGRFRPSGLEPTARLWWKTPATGNELHQVPFYRLGSVDQECLAALPPQVPDAQEPAEQ
jgi:hypothetical protein